MTTFGRCNESRIKAFIIFPWLYVEQKPDIFYVQTIAFVVPGEI